MGEAFLELLVRLTGLFQDGFGLGEGFLGFLEFQSQFEDLGVVLNYCGFTARGLSVGRRRGGIGIRGRGGGVHMR